MINNEIACLKIKFSYIVYVIRYDQHVYKNNKMQTRPKCLSKIPLIIFSLFVQITALQYLPTFYLQID